MKAKLKCAGSLLVLSLAALLMLSAFDLRLKTQKYRLTDKSLSGGIRMVLVTDLHSCRYGENQKELIDAVLKARPDILLLGGETFDDNMPHKNAELFIKAVAGKYPCFYVTGNHELWADNRAAIFNILQNHGIKNLAGEYETVNIRGQNINICGVSDPDITKYMHTDFGLPEQLEALKNVKDNGYYTVLLAHRPELIENYAEYGFDLVLSGHAHGGQWRIPKVLNGLFAPDQGFFPEYAGGEYTLKNTTMIVSRGLASESTPVPRIFNRPELVIIDLDKK